MAYQARFSGNGMMGHSVPLEWVVGWALCWFRPRGTSIMELGQTNLQIYAYRMWILGARGHCRQKDCGVLLKVFVSLIVSSV